MGKSFRGHGTRPLFFLFKRQVCCFPYFDGWRNDFYLRLITLKGFYSVIPTCYKAARSNQKQRNINNKGKITCYLALLPEKNSKSASELEGGAFSVLSGCPITVTTRTTIQTFQTHRNNQRLLGLGQLQTSNIPPIARSTKGANHGGFQAHLPLIFNSGCLPIWPVPIY